MRLRITEREKEGTLVVRIEGELFAAGTSELERVCGKRAGPLHLDLTGLQKADSAGLALIRRLVQEGAQLGPTSPYIGLLLEQDE